MVHHRTVAGNAIQEKLIYKVLAHRGAAASLMTATPISAAEAIKPSAARIRMLVRSCKGANMRHGEFARPHAGLFRYQIGGTNNYNSRTSCPTGTKSVFSKADNCWFGVQQYCCSQPADLTACHWVTKTGGGISADCSNARCNATELEVDRSKYGDGSAVGCDCKLSHLVPVT